MFPNREKTAFFHRKFAKSQKNIFLFFQGAEQNSPRGKKFFYSQLTRAPRKNFSLKMFPNREKIPYISCPNFKYVYYGKVKS